MDEISSWSELLDHLKATYREVVEYPDEWGRFTYSYQGSDVPVGTRAIPTTSGSPWLTLNMKICPIAQLRARSALVANSDLPIGGLCVVPDHAVLRQSLPLTSLRVAHIEHVLKSMAKLRAYLQEVAALPDADLETDYAFIFR